MNCHWVKEKIFPYLDGEVTAEERGKIEAHLASCQSCAEELACFKNIRTTAHTLDELKPSDYFEMRLKRRLQVTPKSSVWSFLWKRRLAWAAALPVLVILSFIIFRSSSSKPMPSLQVEADYYYLETESESPDIQYVVEKELSNGSNQVLIVPVLSYADKSY
ncbi:MAG: zf-HC2 domain-containing protein [candidate division WOR-3 bacterium]|nr:zf-HC2 domain-containing protein [candidate division WOR-3 bacterium]MDH5683615.1 zf-HC2 domain-containing protein [candidate division WOR-3 bacterium]